MKRSISLYVCAVTALLCPWIVFTNPATAIAQAQPMNAATVVAEVSVGELVDKITILEIKTERIKDLKKLANVRLELASLLQTYKTLPQGPKLERLKADLRNVNEKLWDIEDDLRAKISKSELDQEFIRLALAVPYTNHDRFVAKDAINQLCGSRIREEKQYTQY